MQFDRHFLFLSFAALIVIAPLAIGVIRKQVPRSIFSNWAIPLGAVTFLMAIVVQAVERYLDPSARLFVSSLFAFIWISAGTYLRWAIPSQYFPDQVQRGIKIVGLFFLGLGLVWEGLSIYQYLHQL